MPELFMIVEVSGNFTLILEGGDLEVIKCWIPGLFLIGTGIAKSSQRGWDIRRQRYNRKLCKKEQAYVLSVA
jgi:hypothetical protein